MDFFKYISIILYTFWVFHKNKQTKKQNKQKRKENEHKKAKKQTNQRGKQNKEKRIKRKRNSIYEEGSWFFRHEKSMQDNAEVLEIMEIFHSFSTADHSLFFCLFPDSSESGKIKYGLEKSTEKALDFATKHSHQPSPLSTEPYQ